MRILVVEDDVDFRRFLEKSLEASGHVVESMGSAFGLVNRVAGVVDGKPAPRPDVVLLDHMLPGLPGGSALEILAGDERTREVPVVLMSAAPKEDLEPRALVHPRCLFVEKSGRFAPLLHAIQKLTTSGPRGARGPGAA